MHKGRLHKTGTCFVPLNLLQATFETRMSGAEYLVPSVREGSCVSESILKQVGIGRSGAYSKA